MLLIIIYCSFTVIGCIVIFTYHTYARLKTTSEYNKSLKNKKVTITQMRGNKYKGESDRYVYEITYKYKNKTKSFMTVNGDKIYENHINDCLPDNVNMAPIKDAILLSILEQRKPYNDYNI